MKIRHLLALAVSGLALQASAQVVNALYDFNSPATNPVGSFWFGSNGWSTASTMEMFENRTGGPDGSTFVAYDFSGAGFDASAWRTMSAPTSNQVFSLQYSYLTSNYWGGILGFGSDAGQGISMNANRYLSDNLELSVNGTRISGSADFSASWIDFRVDIDLGANGGSGTATVFQKASTESLWAAIDGLSNVNLGLDPTRTATDSTNPLNWDTLWFQLVGGTSGIDNITVNAAASAIPEPSTYAAMAGAAALGLAMWRRRAKSTQA